MNYFDSYISNSTHLIGRRLFTYLRLWIMSHTIYAAKFEQTIIHQHEHLRRESQSHAPAHVLMRVYPML
jgi:hypothetical protein